MPTGGGVAGTRVESRFSIFPMGSTKALTSCLTTGVAAAPRIATWTSPLAAGTVKKPRAVSATTLKSCRPGFRRRSMSWSSLPHACICPHLLLAKSRGARCYRRSHSRSPPSPTRRRRRAHHSHLGQGPDGAAFSMPSASFSRDPQNITTTGLLQGTPTVTGEESTSDVKMRKDKKRKRRKIDVRDAVLSTLVPQDREDLTTTGQLPGEVGERPTSDVKKRKNKKKKRREAGIPDAMVNTFLPQDGEDLAATGQLPGS